MTVMKREPQTLEEVYLKAFSELKLKIWIDAKAECEDDQVEICHSRRRMPTKAMSPAKSEWDKSRRMEKCKKGSSYVPRHKFRERDRSEVIVRYWHCEKEGHIQKFCTNQAPGNGRNLFVRRSTMGQNGIDAHSW